MDGYRRDVLTGIEAGVLGGLVMLTWFFLVMPFLGRPWYLIPNLIAARFYADRYVLLSPGFVTCSGAAWLIFGAGIMGIISALLTRGGWLTGVAMAGAWYLVSYMFLWKRVSPLLTVYAPQPVLIAGFFLYGSVMGLRSRARH